MAKVAVIRTLVQKSLSASTLTKLANQTNCGFGLAAE